MTIEELEKILSEDPAIIAVQSTLYSIRSENVFFTNDHTIPISSLGRDSLIALLEFYRADYVCFGLNWSIHF